MGDSIKDPRRLVEQNQTELNSLPTNKPNDSELSTTPVAHDVVNYKVNIGYHFWLELRQEWRKKSMDHAAKKKTQSLKRNEKIGNQSFDNVTDRVPLSEYVHTLVQSWEENAN